MRRQGARTGDDRQAGAEAVERFLGYVGPGASVLDLGCGAGRDMAWLAAVGVVVVGAGFSPSMLAEARMRANGPLVLDGLEEPVFGQ